MNSTGAAPEVQNQIQNQACAINIAAGKYCVTEPLCSL